MQKFTFHRQSTDLFTDQQNQLVYGQEDLLPFIQFTFSKEHFEKQIQLKSLNFDMQKREVLVAELKRKYAKIETSSIVIQNIESLKQSNAYTITTGHQLSIFTGPIYLIYKIVHVLRMCQELKLDYPENNFIPVFWMASEDHDLEEIQSLELFGKKMTWETDQKGAVGRMETTGIDQIKEEILAFFGNQPDNDLKELFDAYDGSTLGQANFSLINKLFANYGLVIVDGDSRALKQQFVSVMEKDLKEQFSYHAVQKTNEQIIKEGLKVQVNPREINLFYLDDQFRERIMHLDDGFFIEGKGKIKSEDLLFELYEQPENFSPNVVLRPVYQETILPNLCYVGGVGEMSYWLQLKGVFDQIDLVYPLIQPRTSILWIDPVTSKKIAKANIVLEDLFLDVNQLKKNYLAEFASEEIDFSLIDDKLQVLKEELYGRIVSSDPNLEKYGLGELVKLEKQVDAIKDKLVKTVKQRHEVALKNIEQVFDRLFPNGGMQERSVSMFTLASNGKTNDFVAHLMNFIDPFDPDFVIIKE